MAVLIVLIAFAITFWRSNWRLINVNCVYFGTIILEIKNMQLWGIQPNLTFIFFP